MTTGGEGGLVSTNDETLLKKAWEYKDHGKSYDKVFNYKHPAGFRWLHESFGTNWRLTEMQSAIGRKQLEKLESWIELRTLNASKIRKVASEISCFICPEIPDYIRHAQYKCYLFVDNMQLNDGWDRDRIMKEINDEGVPCFTGSCSEIYKENCFDIFPILKSRVLKSAAKLEKMSLLFLVHPTLEENTINTMVAAIKKIGTKASKYVSVY